MRKTAYLYFGLAVLLAIPAAVRAQDNAAALAVQQAVLNQAKTRELREKLADASAAEQRNDITGAAKIYQESVELAQEIGSTGIEPLSHAAIGGLARTALALAGDAQSRQDYYEADMQVKRVLKADPKNPAAIAFKAQNDDLIEQNRGRQADVQTASQMPTFKDQRIQAATYLQDGKLLYEAGKLDEADAKLAAAQKLDADLPGVYYYQNLIKQTRNHRALEQHTVDTQERMNMVERRWVLPQTTINMPSPNPYATNDLIYTGTGRQGIEQKLGHIRFDSINFDGPLSAVLEDLQKLTKLRDPEHKGINFIINPNPDQSGSPIPFAVAGFNANGYGAGGGEGGGGRDANQGQPAQPAIDPATGLPTAAPAAGGEKVDISSTVTVKLSLTDVTLFDLLQAIIMVAEHPDGHQLKYSVTDFGVVFSDKGPESPLLVTRTFKVDPNTFYSGLESVGASSFGSVSSSGGGSSGSSGGGGSSQNNNGAVVGVVNAFAGSSQLRSTGGSGGGGGGAGQGAVNPLNSSGAGGAGASGSVAGQGGLNYITQVTLAQTPSAAARAFFSTLGVNLLQPAGKAVFFNDRSGIILVRATEQDLDTIDQAIQVLDAVPPQVRIKARFIEVEQDDNNQFGLDWYLGQFNIGKQVVGNGGSSGSLNVPTSSANPLGAFPGNTSASLIPGSATDQLITSGLRNTGPAIATITGILTNPNFQVVLHALEQRTGTENLGEPEVTTTSGRQTQMRATSVVTVIYGYNFQAAQSGVSTGTSGGTAP